MELHCEVCSLSIGELVEVEEYISCLLKVWHL